MDIGAVKNDIKNNTIKQLYIFTGPELAVQDIYIDKIKDVKNAQIKRLDTLADIYTTINKKSFISSKNVLILRDSKDFMNEESVWADLESGKFQDDCVIILQYTNIDKRSKMYKHFKDLIVEFNYMEVNILMKYINKKIDLSNSLVELLIDSCERDYARILLELDKISCYASIKGISADDAAKTLFNEGTIHINPKDAIFDFVDAVCRRQVKRAFNLLQDCYDIGESNIALLSVLYNNIKQMLQVQTYEGDDISKGTGLTAYQIKCARDKCGKYSPGELVKGLKFLRHLETSIKTGAIEQDIVIDYFLINML